MTYLTNCDELKNIFAGASPAIVGASSPEDSDSENKKGTETQAVQIYKLITRTAYLFRDQTNTAYARIQVADHEEVVRVEGGPFQSLVRRAFFEEEGRIASTEALNAAIGLATADARSEGEIHRLSNRIARNNGMLFYDLADPEWRVIRVDSEGWSMPAHLPILFVRHRHQVAQVAPKKGGDIGRLFEFISVASDDDKLLLLVWLVACFVPDFPHPIPILHGPQGAGKSSFCRRLRSLIDPSAVPTLTIPRDPGELVQQLSHHYAPMYDNIANLTQWQSDALCRAVTGEGSTKRALYTNDEDIIYHFQRVIVLNGINVVATKADLLDRAILIGLERIAPGERRTEEELDAAFVAALPEILGGVFDTLVNALRVRPSIKLSRLPRMADFAQWGCAIAQVLGYEDGQFLRAYFANIGAQNNEVLAGDAVASAVVDFTRHCPNWEGTPTELLGELGKVAERLKLDMKARSWPKAPNVLMRRINAIKSNLQDAGIAYSASHSGSRIITLHRQDVPENIVETVQSSIDVEKQGLKSGRYLDGIEGMDDTGNRLDDTVNNMAQIQAVDNYDVRRVGFQLDDMDDTVRSTLGGERVEELI
jgi:hypothetical protein